MVLKKTFFIILLIVLGLFLISLFISCLGDRSNPYNVVFLLSFLYCFISMLFVWKKYYNKKLFQSLGVVILGLMWILVYILFPKAEDIKFLLVLVIMSLLFLYLIYYQPKEWEKIQKELENQM